MDISVKERDAIMLGIKLIWSLPFAITIFEIFKLFPQVIQFIKSKNK